ncbi:MAG: molybdopterin-dependent oxidoreductase [Tissierellia bacterium]|nr:molybdopterin-dependent oxidoreductase [Tissierellia bacterium]
MKRFKIFNLLLILLLIISLSFTGCKKKDDEGESTTVDEEIAQVADIEDEGPVEDDVVEAEGEEDDGAEEVEKVEEEKEVEEDDEDVKPAGEGVSGQEKKEAEKEESSSKDEPVSKEETVVEEANTLKVEGMVANPLSLALKDLKAMSDLIFEGNFYSINNFGTQQHTSFKGIKLWGLLEKAQVASNASKVRIVATDGYEMVFTIDEVKKQDYIDETDASVKLPIIIAWEENGVEYDTDDGPPYKLVIGQKEPGDVNKPKWVSNIDRIIVE